MDGNEIRRSYSICTSPNGESLSVGIKKVNGGSFSKYANDELKAGDTLSVSPPEGRFILNSKPDNEMKYAAFAAGSGITPILSILTTVLENEPSSTFYLVYGNQSEEEMMFRGEIKELESQYPNRFFVEYLFSRKKEGYGLFGRIERSTVNYILKSRFEPETFDSYYLCGPEGMIDTVTEILNDQGVSSERINKELFSTTDDGTSAMIQDGQTEVTIILDEEEFSFGMSQQTAVLDAALDEGVDAPYSCRGGICSTCIAKLTEGEVTMRKNQILTDDEVEDGYILTCQSHPTTAKIVVDYDDV